MSDSPEATSATASGLRPACSSIQRWTTHGVHGYARDLSTSKRATSSRFCSSDSSMPFAARLIVVSSCRAELSHQRVKFHFSELIEINVIEAGFALASLPLASQLLLLTLGHPRQVDESPLGV